MGSALFMPGEAAHRNLSSLMEILRYQEQQATMRPYRAAQIEALKSVSQERMEKVAKQHRQTAIENEISAELAKMQSPGSGEMANQGSGEGTSPSRQPLDPQAVIDLFERVHLRHGDYATAREIKKEGIQSLNDAAKRGLEKAQASHTQAQADVLRNPPEEFSYGTDVGTYSKQTGEVKTPSSRPNKDNEEKVGEAVGDDNIKLVTYQHKDGTPYPDGKLTRVVNAGSVRESQPRGARQIVTLWDKNNNSTTYWADPVNRTLEVIPGGVGAAKTEAPPIPSTTQTILTNSDISLQAMDRIAKILTSISTGPLRGRLGQIALSKLGGAELGADEIAFRTDLGRMDADQLFGEGGKNLTITEKETLAPYLPQQSDTIATLMTKLPLLRKRVESIRQSRFEQLPARTREAFKHLSTSGSSGLPVAPAPISESDKDRIRRKYVDNLSQ